MKLKSLKVWNIFLVTLVGVVGAFLFNGQARAIETNGATAGFLDFLKGESSLGQARGRVMPLGAPGVLGGGEGNTPLNDAEPDESGVWGEAPWEFYEEVDGEFGVLKVFAGTIANPGTLESPVILGESKDSPWNTGTGRVNTNSIKQIVFLESNGLPLNSRAIKLPEDSSYLFGDVGEEDGTRRYLTYVTSIEGIENLDTRSTIDMNNLFSGMSSLQELDLSSWDIESVTDLSEAFSSLSSIVSLDITGWDTREVKSMYATFSGLVNLEKVIGIENLNTSKVTTMSNMFSYSPGLMELNINSFDTSNVDSMLRMFADSPNITSLDLSGWNTSKVENMHMMFHNCTYLKTLDTTGWDTGNVETMHMMFQDTNSLEEIKGVEDWNVSEVTSMMWLFGGSNKIEFLDLSKWDPVKLENAGFMFEKALNLKDVDLSGWETNNVTSTLFLFSGAVSLESIDLTGWKLSDSKTVSTYGMFENIPNIKKISVGNDANMGNILAVSNVPNWVQVEENSSYHEANVFSTLEELLGETKINGRAGAGTYVLGNIVKYNGNRGNGTPKESGSPRIEPYISTIQLPSVDEYTRDAFVLQGWNTSQDGSGEKYPPGSTFLPADEEIILYAQWKNNNLGNIDPYEKSSITIHKSSGTPVDGEDNGGEEVTGIGNPSLDGVSFKACKVDGLNIQEHGDWATITELDETIQADPKHVFPTTGFDGISVSDSCLTGTTNANGEIYWGGIDQAVYYVEETSAPENVVERVLPFLVTVPMSNNTDNSWIYNVHVYPKNAVTEITKTAIDPGNIGVGAELGWRVDNTIPKTQREYESYSIVDELDQRLKYSEVDSTVTLDGKELVETEDYIISEEGQQITLTLTESGLAKLNKEEEQELKWVFKTTVNSIGDGVIKNNATVYSNGNDLESEVVSSNWGALKVEKVNENDKVLSGAVFQVFGSQDHAEACKGAVLAANGTLTAGCEGAVEIFRDINGEVLQDSQNKFTTGSDGIVVIPGLAVGVTNGDENNDSTERDYWLVEIVPPAGFVNANEVYEITVTVGGITEQGTQGETGYVHGPVEQEVSNIQENPSTLPLTGGTGTLVLVLVAVLLGGTALAIASRNKRKIEN